MDGPAAAPPARRRFPLPDGRIPPYAVVLLGGLAAVGLVFAAKLAFDGSDPDSFRRRFAELTLQLALIVVLGSLIKLVADSYADHRTMREQDHAKRLELLRRVRAQHVRVAYAQRLIMAHRSGRTYTEQLRNLMMVAPELEDVAEDVKAARSLFGKDQALFDKDQADIIAGLEGLVCYLGAGADEYVRCHGFVDADARAGKSLDVTIRERDMRWVDQLIDAAPNFPEEYATALTLSKGNMRKHVYAQ